MALRKNKTESNVENKTKEKAKAKTKTKTKKKSASKSEPAEEPKPWDIGVTTSGYRDRKRFKLTRSSLDEHIDEAYIAALASTLHGRSTETWGVGDSKPVEGMRVKKVFRPFPKRGHNHLKYAAIMEAHKAKPVGVNSLDNSPILRTSLEIREQIYIYLFLFEKPIIVKYNWEEAERNVYGLRTLSLVFACKLFAIEVPRFIFQNNTVQGILRIPHGMYVRSAERHIISMQLLSNLQNIALNCFQNCWSIGWYEKASDGLAKLAECNPALESLTLVVIPQRVMRSTTAVGMIESNPITFADFLWSKGPFMGAVRKLAPKQFRVILKKGIDRKFEISVDMTALQRKTIDTRPLANIFATWRTVSRSYMVEVELRGLKDRFEEIFVDDEAALEKGFAKCLQLSQSSCLCPLPPKFKNKIY